MRALIVAPPMMRSGRILLRVGLLGASLRLPLVIAIGLAKRAVVAYACLRAYRIRMYAVQTFGYIIHEFDPWFNYRAAEYLAQHGWHAFFRWYDYMSWYPIGRPVGTTIYPGMQILSVWIWEALKFVPETKVAWLPKEWRSEIPRWLLAYLPNQGKAFSLGPMSLNDVCVMVPAWFGAVATLFTYWLTAEVSGSTSAGAFAACVMSIIPAHIMRSYAGEFDNECVAVTTFVAFLWLWARAVRTPASWPWSVLAGVMYACAACTWGGYIFVNNLVALHAAVVVALGKNNYGLYRSYTIVWVIGSLGASRVPVIGWAPIKSLEQMPALLTFCVFQVMQVCDACRAARKGGMSAWRFFFFRCGVFAAVAVVAAVASYALWELGYFVPLGARIRGLFLTAHKTGNPLVDSVSEHQPSSSQAYDQLLGDPRYLSALGLLLFSWHQATPAKFLVLIYAVVSYHYSLKMSRLMIICGPIVSILAGFPVGIVGDWCLAQVLGLLGRGRPPSEAPRPPPRTGGMGSLWRCAWRHLRPLLCPRELQDVCAAKDGFAASHPLADRPLRAAVAVLVLCRGLQGLVRPARAFIDQCEQTARGMANPRIAFAASLQSGEEVIVTDYLDGYNWIKENTPTDSRVIAWWDYGYQITGVANRTSIADGNTWNHEHIATLGRILTSEQRKAYNSIRHLADYALVWAGGRGDDMAKSPHLARIGNSVFPDHCGDDDPLCRRFTIMQDGTPTPMMEKSFLYKAVNHRTTDGVALNSKMFQEVHTTKYGLMRVFKVLNVSEESKAWVADPANRVCDAPGSWYCVGQYPPALAPLIAKRRNFAQLEDFNRGKGEKSAYTRLIEEEQADER